MLVLLQGSKTQRIEHMGGSLRSSIAHIGMFQHSPDQKFREALLIEAQLLMGEDTNTLRCAHVHAGSCLLDVNIVSSICYLHLCSSMRMRVQIAYCLCEIPEEVRGVLPISRQVPCQVVQSLGEICIPPPCPIVCHKAF